MCLVTYTRGEVKVGVANENLMTVVNVADVIGDVAQAK